MNQRFKKLIITGVMVLGVALVGFGVMANSQIASAARPTDGCVVSAGVKEGAKTVTKYTQLCQRIIALIRDTKHIYVLL